MQAPVTKRRTGTMGEVGGKRTIAAVATAATKADRQNILRKSAGPAASGLR